MNRATWLRQLQQHPDCPQSRGQLAVLTALADELDARTGQGTASVGHLAEAAAVSERTAKRAIAWARGAGLIGQDRRGHHLWDGTGAPSRWRLLAASTTQGDAQGDTKVKPPGTSGRSRSRKPGTPTPTPPPASDVLTHRDYCRDCGFELDAVLVAMNATVHAGCTDPLTPTRRTP